MSQNVAPLLTIVATARNDDHGGNLLHRMQLFVNGLLEQCRRHLLPAELILVEWNPPADKPRFREALCWPNQPGPCSVRIIEVPEHLHRRFKHSEALPLFQMIAKNVGIRRARGEFVLATNIDILLSDELVRFLRSGRLRNCRMYRVDRYDVPAAVPLGMPIEAQLAYCDQNIMRVHTREGSCNSLSGHDHEVYTKLTWRAWICEKLQGRGLRPVTSRSRLHTNGCGDFTLMAGGHWAKLRGYAEFEMYSLHMDSLLCHAAHHAGVREQVLADPMRIYHVEHSAGSGWTPESQIKLHDRLEAAGIPQLSHDQFEAWAMQMRRDQKPVVFNKENWGLADEALSETSLFAPDSSGGLSAGQSQWCDR